MKPNNLHEKKLMHRIAQLETALRPFAKEAEQWADKVPNSHRPGVTEPRQKFAYAKAEFNIGHCRRAAKLLATS